MLSILLASFLPSAAALGSKQCLYFDGAADHFAIAEHGSLVPLITDSTDESALHVAAATFADDLERVTGVRPAVYNDTAPEWADRVIMVGTALSGLVSAGEGAKAVQGQWEAYDMRVVQNPIEGVLEALTITGSDKVSAGTLPSIAIHQWLTDTARRHLWSVRALGADGRFTLVLVGRCPRRPPRCRRVPQIPRVRPRRADRKVSRNLHQRREPRTLKLVAPVL